MSNPTVFVTSATGTQGEAVARQLRQLGWNVRATVRDPNAAPAKHLESLGVSLTVGDWDNREALKTAISGSDRLFLNMRPTLQDMGIERVQAKRILDVAKAAGVKHVVYSSGVSVNRLQELNLDPESIVAQSLYSKEAIEELVRNAGFASWTMLRGPFFMANFLQPKIMMYPGFVETNNWTIALRPDTIIPMVDCEDIAKFAVAAFQDPARFHGHGLTVAGDALTPPQMMEQLSAAAGRELKAVCLTDEEIEAQSATNIFIKGQLLMRDMNKFVDLEDVRSWGIPVHTFKQFLERETQAIKETWH